MSTIINVAIDRTLASSKLQRAAVKDSTLIECAEKWRDHAEDTDSPLIIGHKGCERCTMRLFVNIKH